MSKPVTLTPSREKIVVTPIAVDPSTHSMSKFLVSTAPIDTVKRGHVVAVGDGWLSPSGGVVPLTTKVGDVVVFGSTTGTRVYSYGVEYLIMRENEVLAIEKAPESQQ